MALVLKTNVAIYRYRGFESHPHRMKKWKCINTELVFDSKYLKLRKDSILFPSGKKGDWIYWDSRDSVMVVAMTDEKQVVILRQYRYLVGEEVVELPSGGMQERESQENAAKREFKEETGAECNNLVKLGSFYETFGQLNRQIHIFFSPSVKIDEFIKRGPFYEETIAELVDFDKVIDMAINNVFVCTPSAFAVLLLKEKIDRGEIEI
jgi:ADP-ribose pyrophosphatase